MWINMYTGRKLMIEILVAEDAELQVKTLTLQ